MRENFLRRKRGKLRRENLPAGSMRQSSEHGAGGETVLRGLFVREHYGGKSESVDQKFFELLAVSCGPFLSGLRPGQFAAFFTFDPLVLPNLFFDQVGDSIERFGIHSGRDLNVFFSV